MKPPSFKNRKPASEQASAAARGASKKSGTKPELVLRRALWRIGLRYRKNADSLPGRPDIVFKRKRVAVFCDGDFWHGRDWPIRRAKLEGGNNSDYWIAKIERNIERDRNDTECLEAIGWKVLRVWEGDINADVDKIVDMIGRVLGQQTAK